MIRFRLLLGALVLLSVASTSLWAADDARVATLKAADDERVAATLAADRARLTAVLSDELRYAHSSGGVDTKASLVDSVGTGKLKYKVIDYQEREFTFPASGIALMSGRARVTTVGASGENQMQLGFLAVWREEKGQWLFLAWQSCRMPAPAAPK